MPITTARQAAIRDILKRAGDLAAALGERPLVLSGDRPSSDASRSPRVRFVIETRGAADLSRVRAVVAKVLKGQPSLAPGLSWAGRNFVPGPNLGSVLLRDAFGVRLLFPGADPNDQRFKLANFVVLTLPIDPMLAKRRLGGGVGKLFSLAYALRDAGDFVRVDPEIPAKRWHAPRVPAPPPAPIVGGGGPPAPGTTPLEVVTPPGMVIHSSGSLSSTGYPPAPGDRAWNLRAVRLPQATGGGKDIRVGLVDTGTQTHAECADIYAPASDHDCTLDGEESPIDPLPAPGVDNPAHGIAVASVLASRGGFDAHNTTGPGKVTGVASACKVVSVRSIRSVWANISSIDLAEGVWHCVQKRVDVISMSVGGYGLPLLERVISYAVFNDIVVVAAGGQKWPFVPAPALYQDCVAVTATNSDDKVWNEAARGNAIDIAAPGYGVYCADIEGGRETVHPSAGTSFATPTVAAAAVLWLEKHGREALLQRYQNGPKLAEVFRHLVKGTARVPGGWDKGASGAGILDIGALLRAAPPQAAVVPRRDWSTYDASRERAVLRAMLGAPSESAIDRTLGRLLDITAGEVEERMREYGGEIVKLLETSERAFEDFRKAVEAEAKDRTHDAAQAVEDVVEEVNDFCSDVVGAVAGWFG
jgi:hypothetical protein